MLSRQGKTEPSCHGTGPHPRPRSGREAQKAWGQGTQRWTPAASARGRGRRVRGREEAPHAGNVPPPEGEELVLSMVDEMCFFLNPGTATNVRFDGLRGISLRAGVPMQLNLVIEVAGGRQVPRNREAGRRKHGMTMTRRTPRKGRLRPVMLQLIHADSDDVGYGPVNCWRWGGRRPRQLHSTRLVSLALKSHSVQGLHASIG